jgi:hypothetical protein
MSFTASTSCACSSPFLCLPGSVLPRHALSSQAATSFSRPSSLLSCLFLAIDVFFHVESALLALNMVLFFASVRLISVLVPQLACSSPFCHPAALHVVCLGLFDISGPVIACILSSNRPSTSSISVLLLNMASLLATAALRLHHGVWHSTLSAGIVLYLGYHSTSLPQPSTLFNLLASFFLANVVWWLQIMLFFDAVRLGSCMN